MVGRKLCAQLHTCTLLVQDWQERGTATRDIWWEVWLCNAAFLDVINFEDPRIRCLVLPLLSAIFLPYTSIGSLLILGSYQLSERLCEKCLIT